MFNNQFNAITTFFGKIGGDNSTDIYAFENQTEKHIHRDNFDIPPLGGCFGYVHSGFIYLNLGKDEFIQVKAGWWFSTANGAKLFMGANTRVVVWQKLHYIGVNSMGEVEPRGRLGYIDGCANSVLSGPQKKGDPVINALYLPTAIHQTMHTHPSLRSGIIIDGNATCNTPKVVKPIDYSKEKDTECNLFQLVPGAVFILPQNSWHKFRTDITEGVLTLVAYHPDSDFGPTDEEAPMINRTMIGAEGNQYSAKKETSILTGNINTQPTNG